MESLDNTAWDAIIAGTGLPQSLLALALSRSGKKILHVDRNEYYGGEEAALSLLEAEAWAEQHSNTPQLATNCSQASLIKSSPEDSTGSNILLSSRAYSLALAPQLLYARSKLIPALVSSQLHNQLDFQAVGSWFLLDRQIGDTTSSWRLTRVPGGREDVFQDNTLDLRAKRSLMKFLRFVANYEEQLDTWQDEKTSSLSTFLHQKFQVRPELLPAIHALTLGPYKMKDATVEYALPRIARHLTSIGVFGPGFSAVLPKWGGLSELGQVACRACAVGGGVYVLGRGITNVDWSPDAKLEVQLSDGSCITAPCLAGCAPDLPSSCLASTQDGSLQVECRSISIVSSALAPLFPPTSEGGVTPAGAVVTIPSSSDDLPPTYLLIHSSESGECPSGQCVVYASTFAGSEHGFEIIEDAVERLLGSVGEPVQPKSLWRLQYQKRQSVRTSSVGSGVIVLPAISSDLALEDSILEDIKVAWLKIVGSDPDSFLQFDVRGGPVDDDDNDDETAQ